MKSRLSYHFVSQRTIHTITIAGWSIAVDWCAQCSQTVFSKVSNVAQFWMLKYLSNLLTVSLKKSTTKLSDFKIIFYKYFYFESTFCDHWMCYTYDYMTLREQRYPILTVRVSPDSETYHLIFVRHQSSFVLHNCTFIVKYYLYVKLSKRPFGLELQQSSTRH